MCGRFVLRNPAEAVRDLFGFEEPLDWPARYNVAPTQDVLALRRERDEPDASLVVLRWGLVPFWAKDLSIGARMINARAESAAEKPAFREALLRRRCLIPADAFVEWERIGRERRPWLIGLPDDRPFAMAGLHERWSGPDGRVESCTIITTNASPSVAPLHDRMPVILPPDDFELWLDPGITARELVEPLLRPAAVELVRRAVSRRINDARHDDPACVADPDV